MDLLTSGNAENNRIYHVLLDKFLGCILDRHKDGSLTRLEAIGDIAHLVAAVDIPDGDDFRAYMKAKIEDEDA